MRVAFFGGSFNPPHVGHVLAATYARAIGFERVLAVVVRQHAFGKQLAPFNERLCMARLAFAAIEGVEVSDIEATLPVPNYTLQTVKHLRRRHPDWQLRLLIGSDTLETWHEWQGAAQLEHLAPPFVLGRAGYPTPQGLPNVLPEVSSSEIRTRLERQPRFVADDWLSQRLPAAVLDWIAERDLYRAG